jgi:hypothetical protein
MRSDQKDPGLSKNQTCEVEEMYYIPESSVLNLHTSASSTAMTQNSEQVFF